MELKTKKNKQLLKFVKALRKHELVKEFCDLADTKPNYLEQVYGGFRPGSPAWAKAVYQASIKIKKKYLKIDLPDLELWDIRPDIWTKK